MNLASTKMRLKTLISKLLCKPFSKLGTALNVAVNIDRKVFVPRWMLKMGPFSRLVNSFHIP